MICVLLVGTTLPLLSARAQVIAIPNSPPRHWTEQVTDTTGTRDIVSLVFKTTPGVLYSVQTSEDLSHWQTLDDEFYGLGQEVVIPMISKNHAAVAGGGGGSGPPPTVQRRVNVSLYMQRAMGGGLLLSWRSLETGNAMRHYLPEDDAVAEWDQMPFYWNTFDGYSYMIACSPTDSAPPMVASGLGPADQEMVETFQESLPAMNAEVVASVVRARNSVQEPASSAGFRKFWRVVPNWSLDSDGDSTPDWLEFDLIARDPGSGSGGSGSGGNEGGPRGDPFSGDTNQNGIPDGDELDSDGDGIVDKNDAAMFDEQIDWTKSAAMRFAWFDVILPTEGDPLLGDENTPFQVNDQGKVLFKNSLWHNGGLVDLSDTGTDLSFCGSIALGDDGMILGQGAIDFPGDEYETTVSCMVRWTSAGGAPAVLKTGDIHPQVTRHVGYGYINPDMVLNGNNEFIGYPATKVDYNAAFEDGGAPRYVYNYPVPNPPKVWKLKPGGSGGDTVTSGTNAPDFAGWVDAGGGFGGIGAGSPGKSTFGGGDDIHEFEESYNRSVKLPNGVTAMMKGYDRAIAPANMKNGSPPQYYAGNQWTTIAASSSFHNALDFSTEGRFAITHDFGIWYNGKVLPVWDCSPGLPDDWRVRSNNFLTDTTRHGWTLAVKKEGSGPATKAMVGIPLFLETPTPWEGLDAVSFTANRSFADELEGIKEEFWIMVPAGGNIPVRIRSGACSATPIALGGGTGSKVTASPSSVDSTNTVVTFSAPADADGIEEIVSIKLGGLESFSKPLRAKIMKPRVVKVSVWPLRKTPDDPNPAIPPEEEFEEYLNDIYKKQINVTFDVTIKPASNSGLADDVPFRVSDPPSNSQKAVTIGKSEGNIQVYIMGGHASLERANPQPLRGSTKGITDPASNRVWMSVDGNANGAYAQRQSWLSTVTHEIGHVLFGRGHPDLGDGPAPLPLTDRRSRIMYSAIDLIGASTQQRVSVKAEWDVAEKWLKSEIDDKEPK